MGIRFRCHHCEHELNLKEFQAGRRARCPACSGRFRVPTASADFSMPLDDQEAALATSEAGGRQSTAGGNGTFNLRPSSSDPDMLAHRGGTSGTSDVGRTGAVIEMPQAIREAPQAIWYVRPPSGGQYGPAEGHLFHTWLQDNRVSPDSLVWRDGWPQWQLAGDVFFETFGPNWRVAQDSTESNGLVNDDTIDNPIADTEPAPSTPAPGVSNIAAARRKKKQVTYGIFIGILAFLALILMGILLSVVL